MQGAVAQVKISTSPRDAEFTVEGNCKVTVPSVALAKKRSFAREAADEPNEYIPA